MRAHTRCAAQVMVPPSIAEGHSIVVDTRDGSFLRRAGVGD